MNLDQFRDRIVTIFVVAIGLAGAVVCGKFAGTGQYGTLAWIAAAGLFTLGTLLLKEKVWILILLCWPLTGRIELLPLPFSVRDLAVMLVFSATLACLAFKLIRARPRFELLDALLWLNMLWIAITYIRNPVGFLATDSERVGGRPYVDAGIGLLAYWVLYRASASVRLMQRIPPLAIAVVFIVFVLNVVLYLSPQLVPLVMPFYSGFAGLDLSTNELLLDASTQQTTRYEFFRDIGRYGSVFLCAYYPSLTLINPLYWKRFTCFFATLVGLLFSGFRSFLVLLGGMFVLSTYFRSGFTAAAKTVGVGALAAYFLMFAHAIKPLPFAGQRALSFIPEVLRPVKFDESAIESGTESTRWRVEMWVQALTTEKYISDKWFGDGYGIMKWQYIVASALSARSTDFHTAQETMAVMGDFHSGPISTIRVGGYVGLALFMTLLVLLARKAAQVIRACQGTPFERPALYLCLPIVFEPFWFTFIFGGFNMAPAWAALSLGGLKLLENSLEDWRKNQVPPVSALDTSAKTGSHAVY